MAEADWERIRTEYITGRENLRTLCERCGVAYSSISKRSSAEKWAQQRKEYAKTVQKKALARASTRDARRVASLQTAGRRMCQELERLMADAQKQLYTHVAIETADGRSRLTERRLETVDDHRLLNLAKAMREMTGVMRNLYDIQTASEREQLAMAREKLEIEREKLARGDAQDTQVEIVMGEETREYVG